MRVLLLGAQIAVLVGLAPAQTTPHSVTLRWFPSISPNVIGYKVYQGSKPGGPYRLLAFTPVTTYLDTAVDGGRSYYYVVTAVDDRGGESGYSNEAPAVIPSQGLFASFTCSPANVVAPGTTDCTLTLTAPAPAGGLKVLLASSNTAVVTVPQFVTVTPGARSATFSATAAPISAMVTGQLTASLDAASMIVSDLTLTPAPPGLADLTCSPAVLAGFGVSNCTVTLTSPAPEGITISLSGGRAGLLSVPAAVTVAPGLSDASFWITASVVTVAETVQVTASYSGVARSFNVRLGAAQSEVSRLSCDLPPAVAFGKILCTVELVGAAGAGGVKVSVGSDNPYVTVPGAVVVAEGASAATFVVSAGGLPADAAVELRASSGGGTQTAVLNLRARPIITRITNAASVLEGPLAPGELVTIFGTSLGPTPGTSAVLNSAGVVDNTLAGTQVLFEGVPAPLTFVHANQINAVTPYSLEGQPNTSVQVQYRDTVSDPIRIPVTAAAPAIFTADSSGRGNAALIHEDGSVNSASNPARRGSIVVLYATGGGATTPQSLDGKLAADPLPQLVQDVRLVIGGVDAAIIYAGSAPGLVAGILQINARVPVTVSSGNAVAVDLFIGGARSQPGVSIAIQ